MDGAEQILGQVLKVFAYAEGISIRFKNRIGRTEQELLIHNTQTNLEPVALILHHKMHDLLIKHDKRTCLP